MTPAQWKAHFLSLNSNSRIKNSSFGGILDAALKNLGTATNKALAGAGTGAIGQKVQDIAGKAAGAAATEAVKPLQKSLDDELEKASKKIERDVLIFTGIGFVGVTGLIILFKKL